MNRRVLLFFLLSFAIIQLSVWWSTPPVQNQKPAEQAAQEDAAADENADGDAAEEAEEAGADAAAGANAPAASEPEEDVPAELVTLGSIDEATGYRMGVTLTNQGAAVVRAELANPRFLDLHDFSGYLGHLELKAEDAAGLLVQSVVDGTPAAQAGLKAGDRLLEAGQETTSPVKQPADFAKVLAATKPRQELILVVERDGVRQTLTATLERRPLEVIRPEAENVRRYR